MRAVWSFWSRPFEGEMRSRWAQPLHHFLAWRLSVTTASRHYRDTMLVTDRAGKALLVDQLGLTFTHVLTDLERLRRVDPQWWTLGKLVAYGLQDGPFVHIDSDVFLWKPLPSRVADSPVFTQCLGYLPSDRHAGPRAIEWAFNATQIDLPREWRWTRSKDEGRFGLHNAGILGGTSVDFLRYYAQTAVDLVMRPEHSAAWMRSVDKIATAWASVIVEEFTLYALVEFHRTHPSSPHRRVSIEHLFPSWDAAYDPEQSAELGYTHLIGDAKANPAVGKRIEERMEREDPEYVQRCRRFLERM
jgi:hypothetical protein